MNRYASAWVALLSVAYACSVNTDSKDSAGVGGAETGAGGSGGDGDTSVIQGGETQTSGATQGGNSFSTVQLPQANASFDYQLGGIYPPPNGVTVISRDRASQPASGLYNICYVNGFQAQPGEETFWRSEHPELILKDGSGKEVIDEDWNELLLDTSTPSKRTALVSIVGDWMVQCKTDGFDAIEIDNLDSYSRSNDQLSEDNNVDLMRQLSAVAHANGLAIAQKNSTELLGRKSELGTDFAVVEECNRWGECADYQTAYGNRVFVIEYRSVDFLKGCTDYPELSIVLRDRDVSVPTSLSYIYEGC